jgi:hypothetical protein
VFACLSTCSATLLGSVPEYFRFGAFSASEDLKEKYEKDLLAMRDRKVRGKKGKHAFNE